MEAIDIRSRHRVTPRPERDHEVALARACVHARDAALRRLEGQFGGFQFESVIQTTDAAAASLLNVDDDWLADFDGLGMLERILGSHDLPTPHLSFAFGGMPGHRGAPDGVLTASEARAPHERVRMPSFVRALRDGHSGIVNAIDSYGQGRLDELCHDLELAFGTHVQVNAYLSHGPSEGFGAHWDDHDVIILQLTGRKYWEIHEPAVLSPLDRYTAKHATGRVVWSGVLATGSALYIPRGWGHRVVGFDELSAHFTIGIRGINGLDVLSHLDALAVTSAQLRADLALDPTAGLPDEVARRLAEEITSLAADDVVDRAVGVWRARLTPRPAGGFVATYNGLVRGELPDDLRVKAALPGGLVFVEDHDNRAIGDQHDVKLAACGVVVPVAEHALGCITRLADERPVEVGELDVTCPNADPACRDRIVRSLLEAGWLSVLTGSS